MLNLGMIRDRVNYQVVAPFEDMEANQHHAKEV
jgi:hypothetical protein